MRWIVRGLVGFLVCGVLAWAAHRGWSAWLAERWSQAVLAQLDGGVVDFTQVGPSDWERVYFFGPYTPPSYIHETLGFHWAGVDRTSIRGNEGVNLVVFVRDGRVVGWFDHPRSRGDLVPLADVRGGFARDAARFQVVRDWTGWATLVTP